MNTLTWGGRDLDLAAVDLDTLSLQKYKSIFGKGFRTLKEQKERGLSRSEAFAEFLDEARKSQPQETT